MWNSCATGWMHSQWFHRVIFELLRRIEKSSVKQPGPGKVCLHNNIFKKCLEFKPPPPPLGLCLLVAIGFCQSTTCTDPIKVPLFKSIGFECSVFLLSFCCACGGLVSALLTAKNTYSCFPLSFPSFWCCSRPTANICRCNFAVIARHHFPAGVCVPLTLQKMLSA